MKSRLSLTCILGFVIFVSKASAATAIEMSASERPTSIYEVQEYAADIADMVSHVTESILSIPPEQHTYENTLRPWNRLCMLLSQNIHTLNNIAESDLISSTTASQALADLNAFLLQTLNFHDLSQILSACSQKILESGLSTPLQRHIPTHFINNSWQESLGFLHPTQEKPNPEFEGAIVDLNYSNFVEMPYTPKLFIEEAHDLQKGPQQGIMNHQFASVLDECNILLIRSRRDRDDDKAGGSLEGGVTGRWGDGKGIQWEGYVKGEGHDGKGNYAEGKVTQKNNGLGEVDVHAGHESKKR